MQQLSTIIIIITSIIISTETNNKLTENSDVAEKLFTQLFKQKRAEHLDAIKTLKNFRYEKQYSMIQLISEKIFTIIQENRALIESSPYIPGVSEFPSDEKVRDALSSVLENTALFSEIVLRFPDIATATLQINNNWDILLQWSIAFCNQVKYILDSSTVKLLHLTSQELGHIDKDPNYVNPYRVKRNSTNSYDGDEGRIGRKKKKKKEINKKPKLRNIEL